MFSEVGTYSAIVGFGGLTGLIDGVDCSLFCNLMYADIDAFSGYIFECILIVSAVGRFVEDDSVLRFGCELRIDWLCNVLRAFDFVVGKAVHAFLRINK